MKLILIVIFSIPLLLSAQSSPSSKWCTSECNAAGDEMANTKAIFMKRNSLINTRSLSTVIDDEELTFKLRVLFVNPEGKVDNATKDRLKRNIEHLNDAFSIANIRFEIDKIESNKSIFKVGDLQDNGYEKYLSFSAKHDKQDQISLYIFDYNRELCMITENSIRCGRTGGFSYILSERTNNIVLSLFDIEDRKTLVHEMGHFFGLYHTFEEFQFGKDDFQGDCKVLGDCLCDTPPDPGTAYEVYVNYSTCEMMGFTHESGNMYNPMINNYMTYYKPCYLTKFEFTQGQSEVLRMAARSDFRKKFLK